MNRFLHYYLLFSLAVFVAAAVMTLYQVMHAPLIGFRYCIDTNHYGEGIIEGLLTAAAIPGMLIILLNIGKRIMKRDQWWK